jgi:myosin-crossreactive antigen
MQEVAMWIQSSAFDIRVKSHVTLLEENMKNLEDLTEDIKDMEIKEGKKIRKEVTIELIPPP